MTIPLWILVVVVLIPLILGVWLAISLIFDKVVVPTIISRLAKTHDMPEEKVRALWEELE